MIALCFSFDDVGFVHLREMPGDGQTLCGKRAFPPLGVQKRAITCDECRRLKPRQLGGT